MMNNEYKFFSIKDKIADSLAFEVSQVLEKALKKNGKASLLLSGGNTPLLFLNKLSLCDIDWKNIDIGLVDERCVSIADDASNEKMIREELLINNAQNAKFIGMYKNTYLLYKNTFSSIDVLILGMGTDGHTASLFPHNEKLPQAYDLNNTDFCISITPTTAPYERISLTLKSILSAENIFLHIEGKNKIKVYNEVIKSNDSMLYPILKVLNSSKTIKVYAHE